MTDAAAKISKRAPDLSEARLRRRLAAETRFKWYGLSAIIIAMSVLAILIGSIVMKGYTAFVATEVALDVTFGAETIDPQGTRDPAVLGKANYRSVVLSSLRERFPDASGRRDRRDLMAMLSNNAPFRLRNMVLEDPSIIGTTQKVWFSSSADIDSFQKGYIPRDVPESDRRVKDKQVAWFDALDQDGAVRTVFNSTFFTAADSREPEQAGIRGAVIGSALTLLVTLLLAFPIGVMAAVYLGICAEKPLDRHYRG